MQQFLRRPYIISLVSVFLALLAGSAVAPSPCAAPHRKYAKESSLNQCKRSVLSRPPLWTGSGTWNGDDLVLVDTVRCSLLPYSVDGLAKPEPHDPLARVLVNLYPQRITVGDDKQIAIQAEANRFILLDHNYIARGTVNAHLFPAKDHSTIDKVYDWALAANDIVAFADVKTPRPNGSDEWATGIVRLSTNSSSGFSFLNNLPFNDVSRKYHRLGHSYITNIGDVAYYILMGDGTHLWRQEKGKKPRDLGDLGKSFPAWRHLPVLPNYVSPQDFATIMREIEKSAIPTSLYGWEGSIYIISRQRKNGEQNGEQQWLLTKVNPNNGAFLGTYRIASNANHIFPVPGPRFWAFIEKGPALGLQEQSVKSMYVIPSERLRKGFREYRGNESPDICQ